MQRAFAMLWVSETAFTLGASLMGVALGMWIFERTGSAQRFAYAYLAAAVPALAVTPFAGSFADRFDRRWVIASCDVAFALLISVAAGLLFGSALKVEHLYVFNALGAMIAAVRGPAYAAAVSQIVPADGLTRARGLVGVTNALNQIGAPMAAGFLMAAVGLEGVMVVEVAAVLAGAAAVFAALRHTRLAVPRSSRDGRLPVLAGVSESAGRVRGYFLAHRMMVGMVAYGLLQRGLLVLASGMLTPLVLNARSTEVLGRVMSFGAAGGLAGSLLLGAVNFKNDLARVVLIADALLAVFVAAAGVTTSPALWSACAFFAFASGAVSEGCAGALWMRKVPQDRQGSVFALIGALGLLVSCVVMLGGSALVEQVLEPAMAIGGAWSSSLGAWIGTGKGRGIGLLYVGAGSVCLVLSLVALGHPGLRRLDERVPDGRSDAGGEAPARQCGAPETGSIQGRVAGEQSPPAEPAPS